MRSTLMQVVRVLCAFLILTGPLCSGSGAEDKKEALYDGKPVSHWIAELKEKGEAQGKAVKALASIGEPAVPALQKALKDSEGSIRVGAVIALANIGPKANAAIPDLIETFAEPERLFLRVEAALAVHDIGGQDAIPQLIEALKSSNRDIRGIAAMTLGYYKKDGKTAVPALVQLLKDDDYWVSHHAASALRWIDKNPKAIGKLIGDLKDKDVKRRRSAATQLGYFEKDGKDAIPRLLEALKDSDEEVRKNAASSFKSIDPEAAKQAGVK